LGGAALYRRAFGNIATRISQGRRANVEEVRITCGTLEFELKTDLEPKMSLREPHYAALREFDDLRIAHVVDAGASDPREFRPRRYYINEQGQRILIGLSVEETFAFETLERLLPADESGRVAWSAKGRPTTVRAKHCRELYIKHENAWIIWAAENNGRK
jgi:hypothetical protein